MKILKDERVPGSDFLVVFMKQILQGASSIDLMCVTAIASPPEASFAFQAFYVLSTSHAIPF
jgi:hypothetical protein